MKLIKTTENGLMKFNKIDAVTSKTVSDALGVRHNDLLKNVVKAEKYLRSHYDELRSENLHFNAVFKDWKYETRGKTYPCKVMSKDALWLMVKMTDTDAATTYFIRMVSEFNKMKDERTERQNNREIHSLVTDLTKQVVKKLTEEKSGAAPHYYSTLAKQMHRAATGRPMPKGGVDHDTLTLREDQKLYDIKYAVAEEIAVMLEQNITAREIKDHLKKMLKESTF